MDSFSDTKLMGNIPETGKNWQNYQVIKEICRGGMGIVYEAIQKSPQRRVAIKVIQACSIGVHAKRFEREIEITANLVHPNIVSIYSVEKHPQFLALVMEYIDGYPLTNFFQCKETALQDKLKIFIDVCKALQYAHDKKIIHRDIKPSNIMITKNGQVKLIDFGLAKQTNQKFDLTKTGEVVGTPKYMAPEQVSGLRKGIDQQTDIYAMGTILYEILTLQQMVSGCKTLEILLNVLEQKIVPPLKLNSKMNKNLDKIWQMSTARNKKERYQNMNDMILDLESYLAGKSVTRSLSRSFTAIKYAVLVISIVTLIVIAFYSRFQEKKAVFSKLQISPEEQAILSKSSLAAIKEYAKNPDLHNNNLLQRHIIKSYCELREQAIEEFQQGEIIKARSAFHVLYEKFPFNPEIIAYLAKTYLPVEECYGKKYHVASLSNLAKAKDFLKICIRLDPHNAEYFSLLGKIMYSEDKYVEACKNFQYSLELNNENLEALEILSQIPYYEPSLQDKCYQYVFSISANFTKLKKVNLYESELKSLENAYFEDYLLYLSLTQGTTDQKMLDIFSQVDSLEKKQNIEEIILSFRYDKNFEQNLERLPQKIKDKFDLLEIVKKTQEMQNQEYKNFCYYLLAYMFNRQNWEHPNLKNQNEKIAFQKRLLEIISSESEHCFSIYCAIKAYIKLFNFSEFLNPNQNQQLPYKTQIILTAILRDINIPFVTQVYCHYESIVNISIEEQHFLQYLIASTIYMTANNRYSYYSDLMKDTYARQIQNGRLVVSQNEIDVLQKIMSSDCDKVKVSALTALFHIRSAQFANKKDPEYQEMCVLLKDIEVVLKESNSLAKSYIYNSFWLNKYVHDHIENFVPIYVRGLQDKDSEVKKNVVLFYNQVVPILENTQVVGALKDIFRNEKNKIVHLHAIAAYARGKGLSYEVFKDTIKNCSSFERLFGSTFFIYNKINYLENIEETVNAVMKYQEDVRKSKNIYFQLFSLYFFSLLGYHDINLLTEKDSNSIKNLLYLLHHEANIKISNKMSFDFLSYIFDKVSLTDRLSFAEKYMNDKNLQQYAISPYIALQQDETIRDKFFALCQNNERKVFCQALALGYYRSMEREVNLQTPKYFSHIIDTVPKKNYQDYTQKLHNLFKKTHTKRSSKISVYESWLDKARNLNLLESKYWFELAIFYKITGKKKRAINYLTKAIEIEPGNYLYHYERARISIQKKMKQEAIIDLQKTAELMPDYFVLQDIAVEYQKLGKYTQAEKIYNQMFLQNPFEKPVEYLGLVETYLHLDKKEEAIHLLYCISEIYRRKQYNLIGEVHSYIPRETLQEYNLQYPKLQGIMDEFYGRYYK